jgi:hypothetical protein
MSEPNEQNPDERESQQTEETTPAGSYRIPGQDTSGYLGVDSEYMNAANPGDQAILTDNERYLFLPADEEGEDDELDGDVDEDDEELKGPDEVGEVVQVSSTPAVETDGSVKQSPAEGDEDPGPDFDTRTPARPKLG